MSRKHSAQVVAFRVSDDIGWVVETSGIRLLKKSFGEILFLRYPEAAVWDLIQRYETVEEIFALLEKILDRDREGVGRVLFSCIRRWTAEGILKKA